MIGMIGIAFMDWINARALQVNRLMWAGPQPEGLQHQRWAEIESSGPVGTALQLQRGCPSFEMLSLLQMVDVPLVIKAYRW